MKIEGRFTLLVSDGKCLIEVQDHQAGVTFLRIELNADQYMRVLSRQASVDCELDLVGLDKIGKKLEVGKFEFKALTPNDYHRRTYEYEKQLQELAQSQLKDGWIAESYFGSQHSFFQKDGEQWARVTIRRWV